MPDLSQFKVVGREEDPTEVVEQTEQAKAPVIEAPVIETPIVETPVSEALNDLSVPVEVKNDFPTERFGDRFKSWEEIDEALNKPAIEAPEYDEFLQKVIEKYQTTGNLEDFFKAHSVDYDKLSDEELVKRDFFAKNSDLSEKAANKLWERELAKYKLDPEDHDEEDVEIASAILKREANKLRESGKESQKQYLQPSIPAVNSPSVDDLVKTVHSMPESQSMKSKKTISFTAGDSVINYGVDDVNGALDLMADEEKFGALFLENGRPNVEKWVKAIEFVRNEGKIVKTLIDQGIAMGQKMLEKEIRNPVIPTQQPDKFNGSTFKERFVSTLAQQQGLT
jgi:hypothetical protein